MNLITGLFLFSGSSKGDDTVTIFDFPLWFHIPYMILVIWQIFEGVSGNTIFWTALAYLLFGPYLVILGCIGLLMYFSR